MPAPSRRKAAKLRPWRVSLIRAATTFSASCTLQTKAAKAAAIAEFKIGEDQRRRLIIIIRPNDD
jgi:hypothetical protein